MADILLIQPPIQDFYLTAKRTIPYGLASIAAALIRDGWNTIILDALATTKAKVLPWPEEMDYLKPYYRLDQSPFSLFHTFKHYGLSLDYLGQYAKHTKAKLIGISSLFSAYSDMALRTAEVIKNYYPPAKIVLGGHHPTSLPAQVMQNEAVDFVIRGEGEVAMPLLAKALHGEGDFASVPGLVFRQAPGELHINSPAKMNELDGYPTPATQLLHHSFYQQQGRGRAVIVTSRGCPMKCSYCSVGANSPLPYRKRSVDKVFNEIMYAIRHQQAGFIDFEDENLSLDREWLGDLLKRLTESGLTTDLELRAMNGLLPSTLDEPLILAMKAAGFSALNLSLGSSCPEQLRRFHRSPMLVDHFDRVLQLAEKHQLPAVAYIIIGAPGQTACDSLNDLLFLAQRRVLVGLSVFYPSPDSEDFQRCQSANLIPTNMKLWRSSALPIEAQTNRLELITLLRLGRMVNFMKSLIDEGKSIPEPKPLEELRMDQATSRHQHGIALLQSFLYDGVIRGIAPDGKIYEHQTAGELCAQFLKRLRVIKIRGTR